MPCVFASSQLLEHCTRGCIRASAVRIPTSAKCYSTLTYAVSKGTIVSNVTCLSQAVILFINRLLSLIIQTTYIYSWFYTTDPCRAVKREGYTSQSPIYRNALMPLRPSQILPNMLALPEKQFHHLKYFFCHPICVRVQVICARSLSSRFHEFLTTPTLAGWDDCQHLSVWLDIFLNACTHSDDSAVQG